MGLVDELKENIRLNKFEALSLTKEYFLMYLVSLVRDYKGSDNRVVLKEKLKEYYSITKEENDYLHFLLDNIDLIKNEKTLNHILDNLDMLNEQTYLHYDNVLKEYEDCMFYGTLDRKIVPPRHFSTIIERTDYLEEILGLTLTDANLAEYYSSYDEFKTLFENAKVLDISLEEGMDFFGCYPKEDEETGVITMVNICVPKITDLKSMCVNVDVFRNGLDIYPYIGKVLPEIDYEARAKEEEVQFRKTYLQRMKISR